MLNPHGDQVGAPAGLLALLPWALVALGLGSSACTRATSTLSVDLQAVSPGPPINNVKPPGSSSSGSSSGGGTGSPPTLSLTADSTQITSGASTKLRWNTEGATTITLLPVAAAGTATVSGAGELSVSPTATTTYGVTAIGPGGIATQAVTVVVGQAPPDLTTPPQVLQVSAPQAPAELIDTVTVALTVAGASTAGNDAVITDCDGPGSIPLVPQPITTSQAPDGNGNTVITVSLGRPLVATECSFLVQSPDGVGATPVVTQPYWAADDIDITLSSPEQVDNPNNPGVFWYIPQYSTATLSATSGTNTPLPAYAPALVQFFQSPSAAAGGQSLFKWDGAITSGSSDANGNFSVLVGGCNVPGSWKPGASDIYVFIGNHFGEVYLPIAGTPIHSCPAGTP